MALARIRNRRRLLEFIDQHEISGGIDHHTFPAKNSIGVHVGARVVAMSVRDGIALRIQHLIENIAHQHEKWKRVRLAHADSPSTVSAYLYVNVEDFDGTGEIETIYKLRVSDHESPYADADATVRIEDGMEAARVSPRSHDDDGRDDRAYDPDIEWEPYDNSEGAYSTMEWDPEGEPDYLFRIGEMDHHRAVMEGKRLVAAALGIEGELERPDGPRPGVPDPPEERAR